MTAPPVVTRRMLLRDLGRAGLAVMVLGTVACATDPTMNATPTPGPESTRGPNQDTTSSAATSRSTAQPEEGHQWQRVNLDFVSAYILYRDGEAAIVDTGVPGSAPAIEAALGEIGLGWDSIGTLVVTHHHPDHQGSVAGVIEATTEALPWFAGAADLEGISAPTEGQAVVDGDIVNHDLQIIETPGHTPGHISVLDPIAGILVAGDALNGSAGGVAGANPDFSADMDLANASVRKLAGFEYQVALFGHGEPVIEGASALVAELAGSLNGG